METSTSILGWSFGDYLQGTGDVARLVGQGWLGYFEQCWTWCCAVGRIGMGGIVRALFVGTE